MSSKKSTDDSSSRAATAASSSSSSSSSSTTTSTSDLPLLTEVGCSICRDNSRPACARCVKCHRRSCGSCVYVDRGYYSATLHWVCAVCAGGNYDVLIVDTATAATSSASSTKSTNDAPRPVSPPASAASVVVNQPECCSWCRSERDPVSSRCAECKRAYCHHCVWRDSPVYLPDGKYICGTFCAYDYKRRAVGGGGRDSAVTASASTSSTPVANATVPPPPPPVATNPVSLTACYNCGSPNGHGCIECGKCFCNSCATSLGASWCSAGGVCAGHLCSYVCTSRHIPRYQCRRCWTYADVVACPLCGRSVCLKCCQDRKGGVCTVEGCTHSRRMCSADCVAFHREEVHEKTIPYIAHVDVVAQAAVIAEFRAGEKEGDGAAAATVPVVKAREEIPPPVLPPASASAVACRPFYRAGHGCATESLCKYNDLTSARCNLRNYAQHVFRDHYDRWSAFWHNHASQNGFDGTQRDCMHCGKMQDRMLLCASCDTSVCWYCITSPPSRDAKSVDDDEQPGAVVSTAAAASATITASVSAGGGGGGGAAKHDSEQPGAPVARVCRSELKRKHDDGDASARAQKRVRIGIECMECTLKVDNGYRACAQCHRRVHIECFLEFNSKRAPRACGKCQGPWFCRSSCFREHAAEYHLYDAQ